MSAFSAPGESPPLPRRNTLGIGSDIRRDVVEIRTAVKDIHDTLKGQEGAGHQPQSVSVAHTLSLAKYTLNIP